MKKTLFIALFALVCMPLSHVFAKQKWHYPGESSIVLSTGYRQWAAGNYLRRLTEKISIGIGLAGGFEILKQPNQTSEEQDQNPTLLGNLFFCCTLIPYEGTGRQRFFTDFVGKVSLGKGIADFFTGLEAEFVLLSFLGVFVNGGIHTPVWRDRWNVGLDANVGIKFYF